MKSATKTHVAACPSDVVIARLLRAALDRIEQAKRGEMAKRGDFSAVRAAETAYAELQHEMATLWDERRPA